MAWVAERGTRNGGDQPDGGRVVAARRSALLAPAGRSSGARSRVTTCNVPVSLLRMDTASGQRDPEGMGRLSAARRPEQQATAQGGHGGSMPPPSNGLDEPRAGAAPARGDGTAHEGDAHRRRPPRGGRGGRRHRRVRTTGTPVSAPAPTGPVRTCISTQNLFIVGCDDRGMLTTPAPDRRGEARRSARRWGTANQSRPAPPPRVAMPPPARGRPTVMGNGWAARHRGPRRPARHRGPGRRLMRRQPVRRAPRAG